jgi:hypothetical protein
MELLRGIFMGNREILRNFITSNKMFLKRVDNLYALKERFSNYIEENHLEENDYMRKIERMICKEILKFELSPINNFMTHLILSKHIVKKMIGEASASLIIRDNQIQQINQAMEGVRERYYKDEEIAIAKRKD